MKHIRPMLAATGWGSRTLFGLAGAAMAAVLAWPVHVDSAPEQKGLRGPATADESVLQRPLFDPGRRAWTARGSREAVLEGEPHRPVLMVRGIIVDETSARVLIDDGSGDTRWLEQSEGRDGWHVTAITPERVMVDQNGRAYTAEFMGQPATLRPLPLQPVLRR